MNTSGSSLHSIELVLLLLLLFVAGFAWLTQRLKVPYPIVLVIAAAHGFVFGSSGPWGTAFVTFQFALAFTARAQAQA